MYARVMGGKPSEELVVEVKLAQMAGAGDANASDPPRARRCYLGGECAAGFFSLLLVAMVVFGTYFRHACVYALPQAPEVGVAPTATLSC